MSRGTREYWQVSAMGNASGWHRRSPSAALTKARNRKYNSPEHRGERARRLTQVKPGDPCGYCGQPLPTDTTTWNLPHNAAGTAYLPGMWHARCNQIEAAKRGALIANAQRKARRQGTAYKPPSGPVVGFTRRAW